MKDKRRINGKTAAAVLEHYFGERPRRIRELGGGLVNHVFEASVNGRGLVVRMSEEPSRLPVFMKEQWAVKKAREHDVPVPDILEVGNEIDGTPYMILEKIEGRSAEHHPERLRLLREMGELARRINSIRTKDFGHIFDWSRNRLSRNKTWAEFLDQELHVENRLRFYRTSKLLSAANLRALAKGVERLRALKQPPFLTHGDVRLKNVMLNEKGKIRALIDWENCSSNLAPYWELSIALHDLTIDEKEVFLEGYGLSPEEFAEIAPMVKTLNILNYYGPAKAKRDGPPWLKARLNGAFDLYSIGP